MYQHVKSHPSRTVGMASTMRALRRQDNLVDVYLAKDADRRVIQPLILLCEDRRISVHWVDSQAALGEACGLSVGAAAVGLLKEA